MIPGVLLLTAYAPGGAILLESAQYADLNYNLKELVIHIRMSQLSTILDVKAIKNFRFDKVD